MDNYPIHPYPSGHVDNLGRPYCIDETFPSELAIIDTTRKQVGVNRLQVDGSYYLELSDELLRELDTRTIRLVSIPTEEPFLLPDGQPAIRVRTTVMQLLPTEN